MKKNTYSSISEIPKHELESMMAEYGKKKAQTVRSARAYLRRIGVPFNSKGMIDESSLSHTFAY